MELEKIISNWLALSNAYDIQGYLELYHPNAVLEDTSVGETYNGRQGIFDYFTDYFIGYNTTTKIESLDFKSESEVHINALFDGDSFTNLKGVFELKFENGKILYAKCYLS